MRLTLLILPLFIFACKSETSGDFPTSSNITLAEKSIDDAMADSLVLAFNTKLLSDDLQYLKKDSSQFQFYKIDIDEDESEEIFVRFLDPYFCPGNGCLLLLLDQDLNLLNRFTEMSFPLLVSSETRNGRKVLLTNVNNQEKMLISKNKRYPSNPAMAPDSDIANKDEVVKIFDDTTAPSKTYYF